MTSIVVVIMSFIVIFIIPREAASMQLTDNFKFDTDRVSPITRGRCPIIETRNFDVISYDKDSSKFESCATIEFEIQTKYDTEMSFFMIFGSLNYFGQRMCKPDNERPVMVFTCTPQSASPPANPYTDGSLIMRLYGRFIESNDGYDVRCAMYKNVEGMMYLMAISANKSCDGLPHMLANSQASFPEGYALLQSNISRYSQRRKRSTSDTKNTIKNHSGSRFFWRTG